MSASEGLRRIVRILSASAWVILGIALVLAISQISTPSTAFAIFSGGIVIFALVQGIAWVLAGFSGNAKGADGMLSWRMLRRPTTSKGEHKLSQWSPGPIGVGGILWLPIIGLIAFGPLSAVSQTLKALTDAENLYPTIRAVQAWSDYKTAAWVLVAVSCAISIVAGFRLLNGRSPHVVRLAVIALWLRGPVMTLTDAYLASALLKMPLAEYFGDERILGAFVGSIIICAIWSLYFKFSRRVHNTYYRKMVPPTRGPYQPESDRKEPQL